MTNKIKNIPNFLIIGVAKCGTTSLSKYLDENDHVLLSKNKEPRYLTYDILKDFGYQGPGDFRPKKRSIKSFDQYKRLFEVSNDKITAIGEASVDTVFYHEKTIEKIKRELGSPKIIIMLRDPVKRAISAYSHMVREDREKLPFEEALRQESERLKNGYEFIWGYVKGGLYYEQLVAYIDNFENVKVIIFEDFVQNVKGSVHDVLDFLQIEDKHEFEDVSYNKSGKPKYPLINKILTRDFAIKRMLKTIIRKDKALKIKNKVQAFNLENIEVPIPVQRELYKKFEKDISLTEGLLKKDLSFWKKPYL